MNRFIDYRNKQFTPKKPDNEIQEMVYLSEKAFNNSRGKLKEIKNPDSNTINSVIQLNKSIDEAMMNLNEQKAFLDKYFKTGKCSKVIILQIHMDGDTFELKRRRSMQAI